jgi:N utilization substance protein B
MTARTRAREVALQLLYWNDLNPRLDRAEAEQFARGQLRERSQLPFCLALYEGVRAQLGAIDRQLGAAAQNWRLLRMAVVDRNVLRLGAYELLHTPETPPRVALDEAIELARRYGAAGSSAFVNGVLDRLLKGAAPAGAT